MSTIANSFQSGVSLKNNRNEIGLVLEDPTDKFANTETGDLEKWGTKEKIGWSSKLEGGLNDVIGGGRMRYSHQDLNGDGIVDEGEAYNNSAQDILHALLLGDGIDGVELIGLDGDSFTIAVNGKDGSKDFMIFEGRVAEQAIAGVDAAQDDVTDDLRPTNGGGLRDLREFAVLDMSDPDALLQVARNGNYGQFQLGNKNGLIDPSNPDSIEFVKEFLTTILAGDGYDGVEVIDVDADSIALSLTRGDKLSDTLLITNLDAVLGDDETPMDLLRMVELTSETNSARESKQDPFTNDDSDFNIIDWDGKPGGSPDGQKLDTPPEDGVQDLFATIQDEFEFDFGKRGQITNGTQHTEDGDLLNALVASGGEYSDEDETLTLVGVDSDSFTVSYEFNGNIDYFVFDYA